MTPPSPAYRKPRLKQLNLFHHRPIKHAHRIADFDATTATGYCPTCGPVEVRVKIRNGKNQYCCRVKERADRKLARQRHPDRFAIRCKRGNAKWKAKPGCRELEKKYMKGWLEKNPGKNAEYANKKRAKRDNRVPPWAELEAISRFYRKCPKGFQVDHIIPLIGEKVSGLHVLGNLQYLTAYENNSKGNRFEPFIESFEGDNPTLF